MKKTKIKKEYCEKCGKQKVLKNYSAIYNFVKYDKDTGKEILLLICGDIHCTRGCVENGGHIYKSTYNFWSCSGTESCARCPYFVETSPLGFM